MSDAELLVLIAQEIVLDGGVTELSLLPTYNPKIRRLLGSRKLLRFLEEYSVKTASKSDGGVDTSQCYFELIEQPALRGDGRVQKVRLLSQPPTERKPSPVGADAKAVACTRCQARFTSRNALFKHLRKAAVSDTTLTASSSVATGTVQHRRNVSATAVLTAAREELCRHDDEQVKATGVPLAWLVDSSKAKAALRQYTRDSGALARAAQRDDEGLLQLEPLQPDWWVVAMRELCTLLTTQAQEFDLRAGDSSIAFNAYKGGVSQASADLDAAELKRIRVRLVASPTGACTTAAGSKHCLVQARKGHGMVQREDSRYVCGDDCSDDPIPCVCVTGFHHTGTTLLRHILGSHPDAYELPAEIAPTHLKLRRLRQEAENQGAKVVVIKQPATTMRIVRSLEKICREDSNFHCLKIRRNVADTLYSLSLRFKQPLQGTRMMAELSAYREIYDSTFMAALPEVQLETLSADPEQTLMAICAWLNSGRCRSNRDHAQGNATPSATPVVLEYHEAMLLFHKNGCPFDNRGRKIEIPLPKWNQPGPGKQLHISMDESHDARRVRQIHSTLQYSLHPWRVELRKMAPLQPEHAARRVTLDTARSEVGSNPSENRCMVYQSVEFERNRQQIVVASSDTNGHVTETTQGHRERGDVNASLSDLDTSPSDLDTLVSCVGGLSDLDFLEALTSSG